MAAGRSVGSVRHSSLYSVLMVPERVLIGVEKTWTDLQRGSAAVAGYTPIRSPAEEKLFSEEEEGQQRE